MTTDVPGTDLPNVAPLALPFVRADETTLSLHFNLSTTQSRMVSQRPFDLDLPYTKTMMGFLLALPRPAHILMIGLGGGSLAKFCYRHMPDTRYPIPA